MCIHYSINPALCDASPLTSLFCLCVCVCVPLYHHGLFLRRDLKEQLIGQFGRTVQELFTHLEGSELVHGVAEHDVCAHVTVT